jgi:anti-sigma factor RsiW
VRLMDMVLRQGHLSEQALMEALTGGNRPAHLDRCDLCAERAVEMARWMDAAREDAREASDAVFTPERLAAQQAQVLRRLEQVDSPARVISFPATLRAERGDAPGRRVGVSWVGIAAAAGLAIGIVGGQMSARLMQGPPAPPLSVDAATSPVDAAFLEQSYDQLNVAALEALDEATPKLSVRSNR